MTEALLELLDPVKIPLEKILDKHPDSRFAFRAHPGKLAVPWWRSKRKQTARQKVLIHRIRSMNIYFRSHYTYAPITYWCGNSGHHSKPATIQDSLCLEICPTCVFNYTKRGVSLA